MRVVIAAGGTAGHVNPALALAEALEGDRTTFIGTAQGVEARLVPDSGGEFEAIEVRGFDRARPASIVGTGFLAARAVVAARRVLRRIGARVAVGIGGYVSLPVCLAARSLGMPVVLHEQNIVFGLANRVCKPFARTIAVSFEQTLRAAGGRGVLVGNPVAADIARGDRAALRDAVLTRWGLRRGVKTLLVFGGSQGAKRINDSTRGLAESWRGRSDRQVLHITGAAHESDGSGPGDNEFVLRRVPYVARMMEAYAVADLVVCRGGATTIAELTAIGLPSIIVPYPHHRDRQQYRHGEVLERAGAALVVDDEDATGERIAREADRLFDDEASLAAMARAAARWGRPDAARRLAEIVREGAA
jgi:UDP-N-acetylglucosamine--N-acetylmuramyl-(pentapeptide) pyrophosphoryl-undecaprenol N-acetylglucosamine transferase